MNEALVRALADFVENVPDHFTMTGFIDRDPYRTGALDPKSEQPAGYLRPDIMRAAAVACGTQADLSGWSMLLFLTPAEYARTPCPVDAATSLLELTREQAVRLFLTDDGHPARAAIHADRDRITAPDAARTLRHLAQTGKVRWEVPCGYRCAECNPISEDQW